MKKPHYCEADNAVFSFKAVLYRLNRQLFKQTAIGATSGHRGITGNHNGKSGTFIKF